MKLSVFNRPPSLKTCDIIPSSVETLYMTYNKHKWELNRDHGSSNDSAFPPFLIFFFSYVLPVLYFKIYVYKFIMYVKMWIH